MLIYSLTPSHEKHFQLSNPNYKPCQANAMLRKFLNFYQPSNSSIPCRQALFCCIYHTIATTSDGYVHLSETHGAFPMVLTLGSLPCNLRSVLFNPYEVKPWFERWELCSQRIWFPPIIISRILYTLLPCITIWLIFCC